MENQNNEPEVTNQTAPAEPSHDITANRNKVLVGEAQLNELIQENRKNKAALEEVHQDIKQAIQVINSIMGSMGVKDGQSLSMANVAMMVPKLLANKDMFEPLLALCSKYQHLSETDHGV